MRKAMRRAWRNKGLSARANMKQGTNTMTRRLDGIRRRLDPFVGW